MTFTETKTVDATGTPLTAEVLTEAFESPEARSGLAVTDETTLPEINVGEPNKAAPFNFGKGRNGFRNIGVKKLGLVNKLAMTLARLQAKGINSDFVLKKFTDWKGPIRTPTKKISGIISQVKAFENA